MKLVGIALAALAGGGAALAAAPPVADAPGLIVSQGGRIYVEGRAVGRGTEPAWSPDGRRIPYQRRGEINVADADGRHQPRQTPTPRPERA